MGIEKTVLVLALSTVLAGPVFADPVDPNLVAWWKLDGDLSDASGHGHDGGTFLGDAHFEPGMIGQALALNGTGDYVIIDGYTGVSGTQSRTVTAWIQTTGLGDFISWGDNTAGLKYIFRVQASNGTAGAIRTEVSGGYIVGSTDVRDGEWHHAASVIIDDGSPDATEILQYLDGVPEATSAVLDEPINTSATRPVWIGEGHHNRPFPGMIDDVRIYNRALTAAEIKALAARPRAYGPSPADGATAVSLLLFAWKPGDSALFHDLYLGTSPELTEADRVATHQPLAMYFHAPGLAPGVTYYWRIDEIEADAVTVHTGDVWSFTTQGLAAYLPDPADGSVEVSPTPMLKWLPGQVVSKHHVYFSDSLMDVNTAATAADQGQVPDPNFAPGTLAGATTYYWRVDEVRFDGTVRAGPVWTFTTYVPVDDFESYTDEEGSRIYETWVDGLTNSTGSLVGYLTAPFAEQTIVHSGQQSMPLDYNNVNAPFYSEAEREYATAQDWTAGDVTTLVLFVRGKAGNGPAPLYLIVADASNKTATVIHPDATVIGTARWSEWKIPLSDLTGVNLARVKKITVGLGDKADPKAGGAGLIYVDDIRRIKS
jgi:hypothetical protein